MLSLLRDFQVVGYDHTQALFLSHFVQLLTMHEILAEEI